MCNSDLDSTRPPGSDADRYEDPHTSRLRQALAGSATLISIDELVLTAQNVRAGAAVASVVAFRGCPRRTAGQGLGSLSGSATRSISLLWRPWSPVGCAVRGRPSAIASPGSLQRQPRRNGDETRLGEVRVCLPPVAPRAGTHGNRCFRSWSPQRRRADRYPETFLASVAALDARFASDDSPASFINGGGGGSSAPVDLLARPPDGTSGRPPRGPAARRDHARTSSRGCSARGRLPDQPHGYTTRRPSRSPATPLCLCCTSGRGRSAPRRIPVRPLDGTRTRRSRRPVTPQDRRGS